MKAINDKLAPTLRSDDLRLALIGWPGNVLHTYLLIFAMANDTIAHNAWWTHRFGKPQPLPNDLQAIRDFEAMVKHATFVFFMSRIEWGFRQLVTFLYPGACGNGSAPFKNIYDFLLDKLDLSHFVPLYDVCRLVRNVVHSNGIFIDPNGEDCDIHWAGVDYHFQHMKLIDFMDDDRTFPRYHGLIDSIEAILETPNVSAPAFIEAKIH